MNDAFFWDQPLREQFITILNQRDHGLSALQTDIKIKLSNTNLVSNHINVGTLVDVVKSYLFHERTARNRLDDSVVPDVANDRKIPYGHARFSQFFPAPRKPGLTPESMQLGNALVKK